VTTYVLVHGGWGGAHVFRQVRRLLQSAGHEVFTPSLTGIGERTHLASPQVTLTTHVQDVVDHVIFEGHEDITLLGYSYGGMVVTGALEYIADRIENLVYLDGLVPSDGESHDSILGFGPRSFIGLDADDWLVPSRAQEWGDDEEGRFQAARRTRNPLGSFTEPVRLRAPLESFAFSRTFIKSTLEPRGGNHMGWVYADRATADPEHWQYYEIDTEHHLIAFARPQELAEILLSLD
jgi:pimeloyl-ACP methyl ester carboxylesterase